MLSTICISLPTTYCYEKLEHSLPESKLKILVYGGTSADRRLVLGRFKIFLEIRLFRSTAKLQDTIKKIRTRGFVSYDEFSTWYFTQYGIKADVIMW